MRIALRSLLCLVCLTGGLSVASLPAVAEDAPETGMSFDIDGNGTTAALTDGLLWLRYLFGFRGDALMQDAVGAQASRADRAAVEARLAQVTASIGDIDGDGQASALTDGVMLLRYLFGFRGEGLMRDALGSGAVRRNANDLEARLADGARSRDEPAGRALVWSDEFDTIDPDNWAFEVGGHGWGNQELEYYTAGDNASIEFDAQANSNVLVIEARSTDAAQYQCWYGTCQYTSTRMITQGRQEFEYGRIEARIKLPQTQGIWPAFWMMGNDFSEIGWPFCGEIDILEHVGFEPTLTHGAMHGPGYNGATPIFGTHDLGEVAGQSYHVYAVDWNRDSVRWYVDDVLFYSITRSEVERFGPWVADHPFFLLLNVAVGGTWPGSPDGSSRFPQRMYVDYVRVYEPDHSTAAPDPIPEGEPFAIPGVIQAEDYQAYRDFDAGNNGGAYRNDDVDIEATTYPGGGFNVGWIQPGEWLEWNIDVAAAGTYDLMVPVASLSRGGSFTLTVDGEPLGREIALQATGGWQTWVELPVRGLSLNAGTAVLRLTFESGEFNVDSLHFSPSGD